MPCTGDNSTFRSRVFRGVGGKCEGRGGKGKKSVDRGRSEEERRGGGGIGEKWEREAEEIRKETEEKQQI